MFLLFSNWIVNIRDTDGQRSSHNAGDLWGGFVLYQVLRSSFTGGDGHALRTTSTNAPRATGISAWCFQAMEDVKNLVQLKPHHTLD